jgi:hypothetical protein
MTQSHITRFLVGSLLAVGLLSGTSASVTAGTPSLVERAATEAPDFEWTCEEHTTELKFLVRLDDGTPVPGLVFDLPYPVCDGYDSKVGGTIQLTSAPSGTVTRSVPYIHCEWCRNDGLDWATIDRVREALPRLNHSASTAGYIWLIDNGYDPRNLEFNVAFFEARADSHGRVTVWTVPILVDAPRIPNAPPPPSSSLPTTTTKPPAPPTTTAKPPAPPTTTTTPPAPVTPLEVAVEELDMTDDFSDWYVDGSAAASDGGLVPVNEVVSDADFVDEVNVEEAASENIDPADLEDRTLVEVADTDEGVRSSDIPWTWILLLVIGGFAALALYLARRDGDR